MRLELIDYRPGETTIETFGTCDLCMSTGRHTPHFFVFRVDGDDTISVENGAWDWGDYFTFAYIENVPKFSAWLKDQEWGDALLKDEPRLLQTIAQKYDDYLYENGEDDA